MTLDEKVAQIHARTSPDSQTGNSHPCRRFRPGQSTPEYFPPASGTSHGLAICAAPAARSGATVPAMRTISRTGQRHSALRHARDAAGHPCAAPRGRSTRFMARAMPPAFPQAIAPHSSWDPDPLDSRVRHRRPGDAARAKCKWSCAPVVDVAPVTRAGDESRETYGEDRLTPLSANSESPRCGGFRGARCRSGPAKVFATSGSNT